MCVCVYIYYRLPLLNTPCTFDIKLIFTIMYGNAQQLTFT